MAIRNFAGNVNCTSKEGYTALVTAIMRGNCETVSVLVQRQDVDVSSDVRGQPPIVWAVRHEVDQDDMLRILVQQRSVDVNVGVPKYVMPSRSCSRRTGVVTVYFLFGAGLYYNWLVVMAWQ